MKDQPYSFLKLLIGLIAAGCCTQPLWGMTVYNYTSLPAQCTLTSGPIVTPLTVPPAANGTAGQATLNHRASYCAGCSVSCSSGNFIGKLSTPPDSQGWPSNYNFYLDYIPGTQNAQLFGVLPG